MGERVGKAVRALRGPTQECAREVVRSSAARVHPSAPPPPRPRSAPTKVVAASERARARVCDVCGAGGGGGGRNVGRRVRRAQVGGCTHSGTGAHLCPPPSPFAARPVHKRAATAHSHIPDHQRIRQPELASFDAALEVFNLRARRQARLGQVWDCWARPPPHPPRPVHRSTHTHTRCHLNIRTCLSITMLQVKLPAHAGRVAAGGGCVCACACAVGAGRKRGRHR